MKLLCSGVSGDGRRGSSYCFGETPEEGRESILACLAWLGPTHCCLPTPTLYTTSSLLCWGYLLPTCPSLFLPYLPTPPYTRTSAPTLPEPKFYIACCWFVWVLVAPHPMPATLCPRQDFSLSPTTAGHLSPPTTTILCARSMDTTAVLISSSFNLTI